MNLSHDDLVAMATVVAHVLLEEASALDLRILTEDMYGAISDDEADSIYELVTSADVSV